MSVFGFPRRFDLSLLTGPLVRKYFQTRSNAFQQLICDGTREMANRFARPYPTAGVDGSIDIFIEAGASLDSPFDDISLPAIIEAKDNDDSSGRVTENIWAAWKTVRQKLERHANTGWTGLFTPWKHARTYVYITSAVIPTQKTREDLLSDMMSFFSALGESGCAVTSVRLLDWSDVVQWLGGYHSVRDYWLGIARPCLLTVSEYLTSLTGFKRYLNPENLPFQKLAASRWADPQRIYEVVPENWTTRIVNPNSEERSQCPRSDVSTVPI